MCTANLALVQNCTECEKVTIQVANCEAKLMHYTLGYMLDRTVVGLDEN